MYFRRIFRDNKKYGEDTIPYMESLAYTVQEFLYTDDMAKGKFFDCQMDRRIRLCDFMTVAHYFVDATRTDFAKATLKDYIMRLGQDSSKLINHDVIDYDEGNLCIYNPSKEMIVSFLWAAWIYVKVCHVLHNKKKWELTDKSISDIMWDIAPNKSDFGEHPLIAHADDAVKTMMEHMKEKQEETNPSSKQPSEQNDEEYAKLKTELDAMKKENEILKAENECLKVQQQEEVLSEDIKWHDKVRLDMLLRLMQEDGANLEKHGNKIIVAEVMQAITELPLTTCKNYCSNQNLSHTHHEEEILKLNSKLQALGMEIRL